MKTDKVTDAKLIKEYQSGNKTVITELVKRWHLTFCNKAYWVVKDPDLAKDIAQESWKNIIAKINDLKNVDSFVSWALRIVYNNAIDAVNDIKKERFKQQNYINEQSKDVETYDENLELKKKLLNAINQLPEQQKLVIKLFYLEEYSIREISKTMTISMGTTKSRLFHAREKLKTILKANNWQ